MYVWTKEPIKQSLVPARPETAAKPAEVKAPEEPLAFPEPQSEPEQFSAEELTVAEKMFFELNFAASAGPAPKEPDEVKIESDSKSLAERIVEGRHKPGGGK